MIRQRSQKDERGFSLVEVLIVIILMGIVLTIASSSWFGVARSRNVDSATNQVAADLRLAHSQATNRLTEYRFYVGATGSTYQIGPTTGTLVTKRLPNGTQIATSTPVDIKLKADGSANVPSGASPITVRSSIEPSNDHTVAITVATSEITVVP